MTAMTMAVPASAAPVRPHDPEQLAWQLRQQATTGRPADLRLTEYQALRLADALEALFRSRGETDPLPHRMRGLARTHAGVAMHLSPAQMRQLASDVVAAHALEAQASATQ